MAPIIFAKQEYYNFVSALVQAQGEPQNIARVDPSLKAIEIRSAVLEKMLTRLDEGKPTILPFRAVGRDAWLLIGSVPQALDLAVTTSSRFVVPTYAEFVPSGRFPRRLIFQRERSELHRVGADLFPYGYYSWRSPTRFFDTILKRIGQWLDLEDRRPVVTVSSVSSLRDLQQAFNSALAVGNWIEAEHCLVEIRRLNLSTSDNLLFLRIQMLAQQQRWEDIWQLDDFPTISKLRLPRLVRAALLTACHASEILRHEQQGNWLEALNAFNRARPRLGLLLTGRFALSQVPVVHMFAYQAAADGDRLSLSVLGDIDPSESLHQCVDALLSLLPPAPPISLLPSLIIARRAMADSNFDEAVQVATSLEPIEQAKLLLEVAFHSGDPALSEIALESFWRLSPELQVSLPLQDQRVRLYLKYIEDVFYPKPVAEEAERITRPPVENWLDWLEQAVNYEDEAALDQAFARLSGNSDERFWSADKVGLLIERLLPIVTDSQHLRRPVIKKALRHLMDFFLQDQQFPRGDDVYLELYEAFYLWLLEISEVNFTNSLALLKLAEALLRQQPDRVNTLLTHLTKWFVRPVPALEVVFLDALDLFAEYGLPGSRLVGWLREWVDTILALPQARDRVSLEGWRAACQWIQPGQDILRRIEQALAGQSTLGAPATDPISDLPRGYRIGIFTLRLESAERARNLLLRLNPNLDIRICGELDLNEKAKAIASNSETVVVVTACVTHALMYGIRPFVKREALVFSNSAGSVSIVRAIENGLDSRTGKFHY